MEITKCLSADELNTFRKEMIEKVDKDENVEVIINFEEEDIPDIPTMQFLLVLMKAHKRHDTLSVKVKQIPDAYKLVCEPVISRLMKGLN